MRWVSKVDAIAPRADGGADVAAGGTSERFDVVVGADGAWSRVRPLLTDAVPAHEGVTLVELGFDAARHGQVDRLVGAGRMLAAGDNRVLIAQRNGHGHIRGYAGLRVPEAATTAWTTAAPDQVRAMLRDAFAGWASSLLALIETGDLIGVHPLHAMPIGQRWRSRPGLTLIGDAAHPMSPFGGEGVNLILADAADAADLADALTKAEGWPAVTACEAAMAARAEPEGAAEGLNGAMSARGAAAVLEHYRERLAA